MEGTTPFLHFLFTNNRDTGDTQLGLDARWANTFIDFIGWCYIEQVASASPGTLHRLCNLYHPRFLEALFKSDAIKLLKRKVAMLRNLGHYDVSPGEKIIQKENILELLTSFAERLCTKPGQNTPHEEGTALKVYLATKNIGTTGELISTQVILVGAFEFILGDKPFVLRDVKFFAFARFCRSLRGHRLFRLDVSQPAKQWKLCQSWAGGWIVSFPWGTGPEKIATTFLEQFREISGANSRELRFGLTMVNSETHDNKFSVPRHPTDPLEFLTNAYRAQNGGAAPLEPWGSYGILGSTLCREGQLAHTKLHAEHRLVLYSLLNNANMKYLGISKLPCLACFYCTLLQVQGVGMWHVM
jgi:hypothetical protein